MENIINQLLSIDQQAQQILEDAQKYEKETQQKIVTQKATMKDEYLHKADLHIHDVEQSETNSLQENKASADSNYTTLCDTLEKTWEENHKQWEDSLFTRCVTPRKSGDHS